MSTRNLFNVVYKSTHIAAEVSKLGHVANNTSHHNPSGYFMKPKSDETRAREASEKRYMRRSNICPTCHMAKPVGTGECENC